MMEDEHLGDRIRITRRSSELIDSKLDEFGRKNLIHPTVVNQLKIFFFHIHFYDP
jgi:hypothetical protein